MRILITGGCGFIGSNMVLYLTRNYPEYVVVNLDKLDYSSCPSLLNSLTNDRYTYTFIQGDILNTELVNFILREYEIDTVLHFAAQTHVDNSFGNSLSFTKNNVLGTHNLVQCCKEYGKIKRFVHISTDEVYGESSFSNNAATESSSILLPTNPYAATKASAEHIVLSYYKSYGFPVILTRSNNIFGPHQHPEKVIPKWISCLQRNKICTIHGNGSNKRGYIYIDDVIDAFDIILHKGKIGEVYNIRSDTELTNLEIAQLLSDLFHVQLDKAFIYVPDRPFNDHRYHINGDKLQQLGWEQNVTFTDGVIRTIEWYKTHNIETIWGNNVRHLLESNNK